MRQRPILMCLRGFAFVCVLLLVAAPLAARQNVPDAISTWSFGLRFVPHSHDVDLLACGGPLQMFGRSGRWMARLDGMAGLSLYGSSPRDFGYLTGAQAGVARVWTGDYLGLDINEYDLELYAVGGGGIYHAWRPAERPDAKAVIPVVTAGFGIRTRSEGPSREIIMLELLREERLGPWRPRTFVRFAMALPRRRE